MAGGRAPLGCGGGGRGTPPPYGGRPRVEPPQHGVVDQAQLVGMVTVIVPDGKDRQPLVAAAALVVQPFHRPNRDHGVVTARDEQDAPVVAHGTQGRGQVVPNGVLDDRVRHRVLPADG